MVKRLFDIVFSLLGLIFLFPVFIVLSLFVLIGSGGPVFYLQKRTGKNFREFSLIKFRTMKSGSDKKGLITIGEKDHRITKEGVFLRKYKLDELPQLFNVLIGDMSMVGPRPEVKKYTDMYNEAQKKVLSVRPGLTDYASLEYMNESEILAGYPDPEEAYITTIMPSKLKLNLQYVNSHNLKTDTGIIFKTIGRILQSKKKSSL
ncbi:MAG: sugar transferase [Bacteroidales bacterium]|nr:sugar transferase [Bacteroidales bacterium]MCF8402510.1 sugar transferase [Bacteroidales bacterium]